MNDPAALRAWFVDLPDSVVRARRELAALVMDVGGAWAFAPVRGDERWFFVHVATDGDDGRPPPAPP